MENRYRFVFKFYNKTKECDLHSEDFEMNDFDAIQNSKISDFKSKLKDLMEMYPGCTEDSIKIEMIEILMSLDKIYSDEESANEIKKYPNDTEDSVLILEKVCHPLNIVAHQVLCERV